MKYLFTPTGEKFLESLTFTRTLFAFDFDGTLAPIASHPDEAAVSQKTLDLLSSLGRKIPCAIVSGRSVRDLNQVLPWRPRYLVGNHGVEGLPSRGARVNEAARTCDRWRHQLERNWPRGLDDPGIFVEDKVYSLALHYRRSRNKKAARQALVKLAQSVQPAPRLIPGKSVINLVPPNAPHKGTAVLDLMKRLGTKSAFYIGDDDTDEDVFSLPDARILTVRVGYKKASEAQFFLKTQSEVNKLLNLLSQFLSRGMA